MINNLSIRRRPSGFTLIELMIVIAIIGILAAIAIPSFQNYQKRARISELVVAAAPYKTAVAECLILNNGVVDSCDGGAQGIPANLGTVGNVDSLTVTDAVITVTPVAANGLDGTETVIYTGALANGVVSFTLTGGAKDQNLTK